MYRPLIPARCMVSVSMDAVTPAADQPGTSHTVIHDGSAMTWLQMIAFTPAVIAVACVVEVTFRRWPLPKVCRLLGVSFTTDQPAANQPAANQSAANQSLRNPGENPPLAQVVPDQPRLGPIAGSSPPSAASTHPTAPASQPLPRRYRSWALASHGVLRRMPWPDTCLRRALTDGAGWRTLHPTLLVGVRRNDDVIQAHAWIRVNGVDYDPLANTYDTFVARHLDAEAPPGFDRSTRSG
jgi:hypothetical protein